jgi:hypothetical protein
MSDIIEKLEAVHKRVLAGEIIPKGEAQRLKRQIEQSEGYWEANHPYHNDLGQANFRLTGHVLGLDEIEADQARDNYGYGHDTEAESKEIDALRVKLTDADSKAPSLVTDDERESVAAMRAKFNTSYFKMRFTHHKIMAITQKALYWSTDRS